MTGKSKKPLSGVGGWLWWLVAGMLVIGPLFGTVMLLGGTFGQEKLNLNLAKSEQWQNFKTLVWVVYLFFLGIQIHAGWAMARRRDPSAVTLGKRALWVAHPVAAFCMGIIVPAMTLDHWSTMIGTAITQIIAQSIWAGIWMVYLNRSIRVRNTYWLSNPMSGQSAQADNKMTSKAVATETTTPHYSDEMIATPSSTELSAKVEDQIYAQIADELDSDNIDKATWTKAYAASDGEDKKSRSAYIKLRFERLVLNLEVMPSQQPLTGDQSNNGGVEQEPQIISSTVVGAVSDKKIEDRSTANKYLPLWVMVGLTLFVVLLVAIFQERASQQAVKSEQQNQSAAEAPAPEAPALATAPPVRHLFESWMPKQSSAAPAPATAPSVDVEPTTQPAPQNTATSKNDDPRFSSLVTGLNKDVPLVKDAILKNGYGRLDEYGTADAAMNGLPNSKR